ncbi:MAG: hypothetical protein RIR62_614 [Pseudomonadota bacterium]
MDRRVWIGLALGALAGVAVYQTVILPRDGRAAAAEAAEAARRAEARARAASDAAREVIERQQDAAAPRAVTGQAPAISR